MFVGLKNKIKNGIYKIVPPPLVNETYSQAGEDAVLSFLFQQIHMSNFSYLEIGVCKPDIGSNTYKFYKQGVKGVLVEADPSLIAAIKKKRPNDIVINTGISLQTNTEADFYIFDEKGYNTFSKEEAEFREKNSKAKVTDVIKVKLKNINDVIAENFSTYPDFLSIDIEGLDYEVLKSLNYSKFPIPVICAETCSFSENHIKMKNNDIIELLVNNGYFVYADTYINTIFVNLKWFNSIRK